MVAEVIPFDPFAAGGAVVTEAWVARQFAQEFEGRLAFSHTAGAWFRFDGSIWRYQEMPVAFHAMRELVMRMAAAAKNSSKMQTAAFCKGVETFARADPVFAKVADDWDRNPLLLGTPTLAIDLRNGQSRPATAVDMLTKTTAVTPDEFEDCPRWLAFLDEVTGGNGELIQMLQRWFGYSLTGDTREQSLVFLWGPGGNGKGVMLNTIAAIFGDYAVKAPMETFTARKFDAHPTELARLHGARMVYASETEEGRGWAEARLKELTGGDPIAARYMSKNFFTFTPAFKLTFMGNLQPTLETADNAMKRRLMMVPFDKQPVVVDTELFDKLKPEWPGILRWMINGCVDWLEHGLPRPAVVLAANAEYYAGQDLPAQWSADFCRCEPGNEHLSEKTSDLFASYFAFCKAAREPAGTLRAFSFKLQRLGFEKKWDRDGRRMLGIELIRRPEGRDTGRTPFD